MNYRLWREHVSNETTDIESFVSLPPLHPCSGQLSINDMRLHLSNTMGSTESGKKVTQVKLVSMELNHFCNFLHGFSVGVKFR